MEVWKKNLYFIWIALFFTMVGMSMVVPFLPLYIRDLGVLEQSEVERWSGYAFAGPFILSFFLTPVWGAMGDKYGKKSMVIRAVIGLSLSQFLIGMSQNVLQLFLFRMFQGAASGFIPASLALVSSSSPKEKSGYSIGILQTAISSGTIVGPLIGGLVADLTSHRLVFYITGSICLISGILVFFFVNDTNVKTDKINSVYKNLKYAFSNNILVTALISIAVAQMSVSLTQPGFALFIESLLENKEYLSTVAGMLFGVTGIATAISSPWWGKRNDNNYIRKNLYYVMFGGAIALILHSFIYSHLLLFPVRILLGICIGGMVPAFYLIIQKNIPDERIGGIMGVASSFTILGNMLGPLSYSFLTPVIGLRYVFIIAGVLLFGNIVFIKFRKLEL